MRATLCLSFDNLGEAAEIGVGAIERDAPGVGSHRTATEIVPAILSRLEDAGLCATFFVEGLNAELYPDLLRRIDAEGHEVAYHAWTHEQWAGLDAAERAANLERGIAAFASLGLDLRGIRPPGGQLGGEDGAGTLRDAGLSYCSPAGAGAGVEDGLAILPFAWRHVDVSSTLPQLGSVREEMTGSADPIAPDAFLSFCERELNALIERGGFTTVVLHPFMLEWFGQDRLGHLLDRVAAASSAGALRVPRFGELATELLAEPEVHAGGATLDPTTWSG